MSTTAPPPRLSHHHQQPQQEQAHQHSAPDEPPPAYTPTPANDTSVLQVGPQYPFGPTPCSSHTPLPAEYYPQVHHQSQQYQHNTFQAPPLSDPPNANPFPGFSEPTTIPTPGRPLLYEDRILVYPYLNGTAYFCPKCCNTGFKGFDPYRPCRKCWLKYGKPWTVVRVSPMTNSSAWTLQRPLPPAEMTVNPPPLVVRPGDPRIGGRLCLNCNGSGQKQEELTLINVFLGGGGHEVCPSCRGTGRIFF